jgi:hypothetical protein
MPRIIVEADAIADPRAVTLRERIVQTQLESDHFSAQLIERLRWAIEDATHVESRAMPST